MAEEKFIIVPKARPAEEEMQTSFLNQLAED